MIGIPSPPHMFCDPLIIPLLIVLMAQPSSSCEIFCDGPILHTIQMARIFQDSKTFVDMPMKFSASVVLDNFNKIPDQTNKTLLQQFLDENFLPAGADIEDWTPADWTASPHVLSTIKNPEYQKFAADLNDMWKLLGKKLNPDVHHNPERHSILPLPHPFVVPGGRFREYYYWDSYWVLRGLLICGMKETARNMIDNGFWMIDTYGIIPNGARSYYLNRSQPPLFSEMVMDYFATTSDINFIREALPRLDKWSCHAHEVVCLVTHVGYQSTCSQEYDFWMQHRAVDITIAGKTHTLNLYNPHTEIPRPESYVEDVEIAEGLNTSESYKLWSNIAAAAESGWDFSSRWLDSDPPKLKTIRTTAIVPVDLNSVLYKMENNLERLHSITGNRDKADFFKAQQVKRKEAIQQVLWNAEKSRWLDYDYLKAKQNTNVYPSSFHPLWSGAYNESNTDLKNAVLQSFLDSKLWEKGGVSTSLFVSQQWDSPNAWPPLQWFLIKGFERAGTLQSKDVANQLSNMWLNVNLLGWNLFKNMMEKYDVHDPGHPGSGGEYAPQIGFGWTNGIALELIVQQYS